MHVKLPSRSLSLRPVYLPGGAGAGVRPAHSPRVPLGVLSLTLPAFFLRLWGIDWENLWWDEALSVYRAGSTWPELLTNTIRIQGTATKDLHPPLYFVLLRLWMLGVGQSEFAVRALSSIAGVLLVPLAAVLAARLIGRQAALPAAALAAFSPFAVWYGQEARMYTLVPLFSALSVYLLLRALEERRLRYYVAYLAATAALLYTHYFGLFLLGVHAGCVLLAAWQQARRGLRRSLHTLQAPDRAVPLLVVLVGAPLTPYILWRLTAGHEWGRRLISLPQIIWDTWRVHLAGLAAGWHAEALSAAVAGACVVMMAVLLSMPRRATISLPVLPSSSRANGRVCDASPAGPDGAARWDAGPRWDVMAIYLLVPVIAIFLLSLIKPLFGHVRYMSIVSPALYSALGGALATSRRGGVLLAGLAGLVMLYGNAAQRLDPSLRREAYAAAVQFVERHSQPGDAVVFYANGSEPAFLYYYNKCRRGLLWYSLPRPEHDRTDPRLIGEELAPIAQAHPRIWLVALGPEMADPRGLIVEWLETYAVRSLSAAFWGGGFGRALQVARYETRPVYGTALAGITEPGGASARTWPGAQLVQAAGLNVNLGNVLRLHQAILIVDTSAGSATATYYWEVLRPTANELVVSTRIVDSEGHMWAQRDSPPLNGNALASQWKAGTFVRDVHDLTLEDGMPPGRYHLVLEVYALPAQRGLEIINEQGVGSGTLVRLGEFTTTVPVPAALPRLLPVRMGEVDLLEAGLGTGSARPGERLRVQGLVLFTGPGTAGGTGRTEAPPSALRARLVDAQGHPVRETTLPLALPVRERTSGDFGRDVVLGWKLDLLLPAGLPGGRYRAQVAFDTPGARTAAVHWERLLRPSTWRPLAPGEGDSADALAPHWPRPAGRPVGGGWVEVGEVLVQGRTPDLHPPRPQHVVSVRVGEAIQLVGYDVSTTSMRPGETLHLTLYWRCTAAMETSYTVFTHLLDPSGRLRGQHDDIPHRGELPTTSWVAGEYIADRYELQLAADAPPGAYWLEVGMYDARTLVRLPLYADGARLQDDRVLLARIMVQPAASVQ